MQLQKIVRQENQKCWGKPLGSQSLWNGHVQTIKRIQDMASHVTINEVNRNCSTVSLSYTSPSPTRALESPLILIDFFDAHHRLRVEWMIQYIYIW